MENNTIFDEILLGKIKSDIVFENEHVLAFRDVSPQAPVHVLVIPKKKINRIANIDSVLSIEESAQFFRGIALTARALQLEESGYRVVINNGADGLQTVEYLHAHILGGRKLSWPPG